MTCKQSVCRGLPNRKVLGSDLGSGTATASRSTGHDHDGDYVGACGCRGAAVHRSPGLGLAIVRRRVEGAGGDVWLEEGPGGRGLRAVVSLPRA